MVLHSVDNLVQKQHSVIGSDHKNGNSEPQPHSSIINTLTLKIIAIILPANGEITIFTPPESYSAGNRNANLLSP